MATRLKKWPKTGREKPAQAEKPATAEKSEQADTPEAAEKPAPKKVTLFQRRARD